MSASVKGVLAILLGLTASAFARFLMVLAMPTPTRAAFCIGWAIRALILG